MLKHLKCPHCATTVEFGITVCPGCGAEVTYSSPDDRHQQNKRFWIFGGGFGGLLLVAGISAAMRLDPKDVYPPVTMTTIGVGAAIGWLIATRWPQNGATYYTVSFKRRDIYGRIVELRVNLWQDL
jgi:hypothetical protein